MTGTIDEVLSPLKASVLVATYKPGPELDGLVASLDAQTLPTDEWEAIFVDDGSPDGTLDRLHRFAATRPHFRVVQIENSGWPCRPRNVGIDEARGEYVVFLDHDDQLFPEALEQGYAYASEHDADILNGKEARTHDMAWALRQYRQDVPQELGRHPNNGAILPTNPHKLYRRAFLNEHEIRFRDEGRVLWEDVFFNVDALRHAKVISTLATVPFYYWHTTKGSGSSTFLRKNPEWWDRFTEVVEWIESLDVAVLGAERDVLRIHQYRSRLIDAFNHTFAGRPADERRYIFDRARAIQSAHFPPADDARLSREAKLRADLLRRGELDALTELSQFDRMPAGKPTITAARFDRGRVVVDYRVTWRPKPGERLPLKYIGESFAKDLPEDLADLFTDAQLDMTEAVDRASATPTIRSRRSRVSWTATKNRYESVPHVAADGSVTLDVTGRAVFKLSKTAAGTRLPRDVWEVAIGSSFGGGSSHPMVRSVVPPVVRIDDDGIVAIYSNNAKTVVIDFDQTGRPITSALRPTGQVRASSSGLQIGVMVDEATRDGDFDTRLQANIEPIWRTAARAPLTLVRRRTGRDEGGRGWRSQPAVLHVENGSGWLSLPVAGDAENYFIRLGEFDRAGAHSFHVTSRGVKPISSPLRSLIG